MSYSHAGNMDAYQAMRARRQAERSGVMSELQLDQDEIVYTDPEDGLAFTRADFPAADYPVDARVTPATSNGAYGTVVSPGRAAQPGLDVVPEEWVPVLWDQAGDGPAVWVRASALKLV